MRKRRLALVAAGVIAILAIGIVVGLRLWDSTHTRSIKGSSTIDFVTTAPPSKPRPPQVVESEPWPTYGFDNQRTHLASDSSLRPPFRFLWTYRSGGLIEFPPSIAYGLLYVPVERGEIVALNAQNGRVRWKRSYSACIASSPAVGDGVVYETMMNPCSEPHDGRLGAAVALNARTGRQLWLVKVSASESSPLLVGETVYFGARNGDVYALNARTGRARWTYLTGGSVKGAPAYAAGVVYVGSYDGYVYALNARTGRLLWKSGSENELLRGRGTFYATPTLAYGRVFVGNTDGAMYAFGATQGTLLWARTTGGYIYSSAAVSARTVFMGSYDQHFYALDAATGTVRWSYPANGPISGSPTVMAGLVYFSTLAGKTYALDTRTGRLVWSFNDGQYSPLVAETVRAYLVGHGRIYALARRR